MFSRKNNNTNLKQLPQEWQSSFVAVLEEAYKKELKALNASFFVFGQVFKEELLLIASFMYNDITKSPITVLISSDLNENQNEKTIKSLFNSIVDLSGSIFDEILGQSDWSDYSTFWDSTVQNKSKLYYKITRENMLLTVQADTLLNDDQKGNE